MTVRPDVTIEVALRYLRMRGELPDRTDCLFVVDRHDEFLGAAVTDLLTEMQGRRDQRSDGPGRSRRSRRERADAAEVARQFEDRDLVRHVVDASGQLLGRVTVDDVVDVVARAGRAPAVPPRPLEEDVFAGVRGAGRCGSAST